MKRCIKLSVALLGVIISLLIVFVTIIYAENHLCLSWEVLSFNVFARVGEQKTNEDNIIKESYSHAYENEIDMLVISSKNLYGTYDNKYVNDSIEEVSIENLKLTHNYVIVIGSSFLIFTISFLYLIFSKLAKESIFIEGRKTLNFMSFSIALSIFLTLASVYTTNRHILNGNSRINVNNAERI